jgi:L-fucose isomerase-like protein
MAMNKPCVGLVVVAHPNEVGFAEAQRLLELAPAAVGDAFALPVFPEIVADVTRAETAGEFFERQHIDGLIVLVGTWSDDSPAVRLAERLRVPVLTWARRGVHTGSLCGAQQLGMVLAELGHRHTFWFGEIDEPATREALTDFAFACGLRASLRRLRVGQLGHRTTGMTEIAVDEFELRRLLGPEVVPLSMHRFVNDVERSDETEARRLWSSLASRVARIDSSAADGVYAAKVLLTLRRTMAEHTLGAVAVDCYPDHLGRFCLAASLLADENLIVACEGDVNGAVAQYIAHYLTGAPAHNTDLLDVDVANHTALFSHCGGGSLQLADDPRAASFSPVRLADTGLAVLFAGKPGPVTMLNLIGRTGTYRLGLIEADAVRTTMEFPGNPLRVRLPVTGRAFLDFVAAHALGHHWMIGYGRIAARVALLSKFLGLPVRRLPDEA